MEPEGAVDVFRAIADPGRRALMDALFAKDGQSVNELCDVLPDMSRFGVMKHLKVLADANLVTTEKVGRSKLNYLNPIPIQLIHDRWIAKYAVSTTESLTELSRRLSGPDVGRPDPIQEENSRGPTTHLSDLHQGDANKGVAGHHRS